MMTLRGKRVTIVGLGRTAAALAKLLVREGAVPFVTEQRAFTEVEALAHEIDGIGVAYECGGHDRALGLKADIVVPSPGVSPNAPPVASARNAGAAMMGEMEIASWFAGSPMLAVTGTNGKTTTTALLQALIAACGHDVVLTGNNDLPLSASVMREPKPDYYVVEVSSYQLETSQTFRPWIATVLNVTDDHLARHGTIEGYAAVKSRIFVNQGSDDVAAINLDDPRVAAMRNGLGARVVPYSQCNALDDGVWLDGDTIRMGGEPIAALSDTPLRGRHNRENVLASLAMMRAGGFDWPRVLDGLRGFRGVEHRIEFVTAINGVEFFNDSKSTNLDSLRVALESFDHPVILLAGGRGKGSDYRHIGALIARQVKHLIVFGEDAEKIATAYGESVSTTRVDDIGEAVQTAVRVASPGDTVLLSPACASFDQFSNFEERGRVFKSCVFRIAEGIAAT